MSFTTAQADGILGIAIFMSTLSFIGSSIIIASYFAFPNLRKFSFRLVVHMAVADWFSCIAYFMANPTDGSAACTFQGLLEQGCQLSSIIWTTIISLTLWMAVVKREEVHTHMRTFLIVGYVLPALTCILPLSTKSFVNTGAWCWIDGETTIGQVWRFLLFYLPLWGGVAFNGYTYYVVIQSMKNMFETQGTEVPAKYRALINRLKLYPLILCFCWFWATVNRFQNAVAPDHPQFWLFLLQVTFSHMNGLLNAIAYGLNPSVRDAWVDKLDEYPKLSRLARLLEHKDGSGNSGEGDVEEEGETAKMTDDDTAL
ncbi:hypothetical protein TeGR_g15136 [Tetraparma gracilis]|uniref:G-protein coupled receptors family 2 profile 2 domain-containing protein n=1 Tax=Tetraparma gracilis TaxID=2962635 RepID=A0ABQ6MDX6_9STRA|nr:hypothetical protein TeGR_g15136 [Tetraparma gracilis]